MGLEDNVDGEVGLEKVDKHPKYHSCNTAITSKNLLITTVCNHSFHKDCLSRILKLRPYCPVCNTRIVNESAQRNTRASSKATASVTDSASTSMDVSNVNTAINTPLQTSAPSDSPQQSNESLQNMITTIVAAQQEQLMSTLSREIARIIDNTVQNRFSQLNVGNTAMIPASQLHQRPVVQFDQSSGTPPNSSQSIHTPPRCTLNMAAGEQSTSRDGIGNCLGNSRPHTVQSNSVFNGSVSHNPSSSELSIRPDRVLQIIVNWRIKFNGGQNGLSVEHFIYRVEALTRQTLNGDFNLLCSNAGLLFEGKADGWFWRYHMSVPFITWPELCYALRKQYKDSRTDIDIRELIRDRKQKVNESFDSFYEAIVQLTDRLSEPLHTSSLVEILRRNLLPEIQHEILNLKVNTVEELRDICRRREFFLQDMRRKHGVQLPKPLPRRVAEINYDFEDDGVIQDGNTDEIDALELTCWNCHKPGHRHQDCLGERTVFCYGCGKPDTYKPNCLKCNSKNSKACAPTTSKGVLRPVKQRERD